MNEITKLLAAIIVPLLLAMIQPALGVMAAILIWTSRSW